jgi:hypothetical protein
VGLRLEVLVPLLHLLVLPHLEAFGLDRELLELVVLLVLLHESFP